MFLIFSVYLYVNLDINEKPKISDIIIVARGGGQIYRETKAKELLEQGYSQSNKVIISPITLHTSVKKTTKSRFSLPAESQLNLPPKSV